MVVVHVGFARWLYMLVVCWLYMVVVHVGCMLVVLVVSLPVPTTL